MFEKVIGNHQIKEMLTKSIQNGNLLHSYLWIGRQGIGKRMLAKCFAKEILAVSYEIENHPDFMEIVPEGNSIKIEQIRMLQKKIQEKPIASSKKVYIINDANTMTSEAQNCLLKTLEEPPEFAILILIGDNENAFLPTIKSRCMVLHFKPIPEEEIARYLKENYEMTSILPNRLKMFQGSIGKAISLKDKQEKYETIENVVDSLEQKDLVLTLQLAEPLYKAKEEALEMLEYMNILLLQKAKENALYTNSIKIVENTKKRLKQNANYDMCIDDLLFKLWRG